MIERLACSPAGPWLAYRDWQAAGPASAPAEVACRPEAPGSLRLSQMANLNFEAAVRLTGILPLTYDGGVRDAHRGRLVLEWTHLRTQ